MAQQISPLKILAIGSPLSSLNLLTSKVQSMNSKYGPFDACVLIGDVFAEDSDGSELNGAEFTVPTYFTIGKIPLPDAIRGKVSESGGEVVNNLVYLGKAGVFTTTQGLKIACAGGLYQEELYDASADEADPFSPIMHKASIDSLLSHAIFNLAQQPEETLASARSSSSTLPSAFTGVDLLILSTPPPSLSLFSPSVASLSSPLATAAPPLSELVNRSRPRYMFWSDGEGFWEREPFGWTGSGGKEERWTRGIKLGGLGGPPPEGGKKARWFYAFTLPPQTAKTPLPVRPANTTPNPFVVTQPAPEGSSAISKKRPALGDQNAMFQDGQDSKKSRTDRGTPPDNYTCNICKIQGHWIQDCSQRAERDLSKPPPGYTCNICQSPDHFIRECTKREEQDRARYLGVPKPPPEGYVCRACGAENAHYIKDCPLVRDRDEARSKKKELGPAECWFCLSNPKVTKHLICAIGQETYVTLPKGQLIPTGKDPKPLIPGGGHVLIIPIAHHPTLLSIPADDAMNIIAELESFKSSLRSCYASFGAVPVVYEVGRLSGRGGHAHVQIIPIPKELSGKVAQSFRIAGVKQGLDWEGEPEKALTRAGSSGNYFKVECPDGERLVHLLKGHFDLQFGRMVLGSLLGLQHRIDWKECGQSEMEEREDAQKFKKAFAPFHP